MNTIQEVVHVFILAQPRSRMPPSGPVKDIIVLKPFPHEKIAENLSQVGVVRLVVKAKRAGVLQVDSKLVRKITAEDLRWGRRLFLHDPIIPLLLGSSLETLPG